MSDEDRVGSNQTEAATTQSQKPTAKKRRVVASAFEMKTFKDVMEEYHSTRQALKEYPVPANISSSKVDFCVDVERAIANSGLNRRLLKKLMRWLFDESAATEANLRQMALVLGPAFLQRKLFPLGRYFASSDAGWRDSQKRRRQLTAEVRTKTVAPAVSIPTGGVRFYPDSTPVWTDSAFERLEESAV